MMIPAPTVVSLAARSSTTTGSPARPSSRARERPPIPPPTTIVERGIGGRSSGRQTEQRGQPLRLDHACHRLVGGPAREAAGGVEDLGQEPEVTSGVQEDAGDAQ